MKHFRSRVCLAVLACVVLSGSSLARIQEGQRQAPATSLASLFNVGGNLGFATIRVCTPTRRNHCLSR